MLAHKEGYFQEFLIYKPEERVWIHLNIDEKDAKIELLKRNFVLQKCSKELSMKALLG